MERSQVYNEIRDTWGQAPELFELLPDDVLALELKCAAQSPRIAAGLGGVSGMPEPFIGADPQWLSD